MEKVLVFIYDDMADFEITYVTHLLGTQGKKEVITIAYEDKVIKSKCGMAYKAERLVKDVVDEDVVGLIIPGGWNGEIRPELMTLIKRLNKEKKLIGAICAGPRFLAKAGLLQQVRYTTSIIEWNESLGELFKEDNPFPRENYVFNRVIRDGHIITAQGYAFVDFAIEICDYFNLYGSPEEKANHMKFITGD